MKKKTKPELLSTAQAAKLLGKSIVTLRRWDGEGTLKSLRGGKNKHRKYKKEDLLRFLHQKNFSLSEDINTFVFDFDSTLFPEESLDEVLKIALKKDPKKKEKSKQIENICREGMEGKISLQESLQKRLSIAKIHQQHIEQYLSKSKKKIDPVMQNCIDFLNRKNQEIIVISGGFKEWVGPIAENMGINPYFIFANRFLFNTKGFVSGFMKDNHLSRSGGKPQLISDLRETGAMQGNIIMVGDGASDLDVKEQKECDFFIGFGVYAKRKKVKEHADEFFTNLKSFQKFIVSLFSNL